MPEKENENQENFLEPDDSLSALDKNMTNQISRNEEERAAIQAVEAIARTCVLDGLSQPETILMTKKTNSFFKNPLPDEAILKIVAMAHKRRGAAQPGPTDLAIEKINPMEDVFIRGVDVQKINAPINYIVKGEAQNEGLIVGNGVTFLCGPPGSGKSTISAQMAEAISTGTLFMGLETEKTQSVCSDMENNISTNVDRYCRLNIRETLLWARGTGRIPPIRIGTDSDDEWQAFKKYLPANCFLVIDTLRAHHGKEENSSTEMALIMDRLTEFQDDGHTILVIHHTGKNEGSSYRGSSVIQDRADVMLSFEKLNEKIPSGDFKYRLGTGEKTRHKPFEVFLTFKDGIFARADETVGATLSYFEAIHKVLSGMTEPDGVALRKDLLAGIKEEALGIQSRKIDDVLKEGEGKYWDKISHQGPKKNQVGYKPRKSKRLCTKK